MERKCATSSQKALLAQCDEFAGLASTPDTLEFPARSPQSARLKQGRAGLHLRWNCNSPCVFDLPCVLNSMYRTMALRALRCIAMHLAECNTPRPFSAGAKS